MTSTFKNLNDSELDLICGGGAGSVTQNPGNRTDPNDIGGDDVAAGNQAGGSASFDALAQNVEIPA